MKTLRSIKMSVNFFQSKSVTTLKTRFVSVKTIRKRQDVRVWNVFKSSMITSIGGSLLAQKWDFRFETLRWISWARQVMCTRVNKNPSAWNFLSPKPEVTCGTVAIIIRVVLLSPYLRIRGVSLYSIQYNQSHRVYIEIKTLIKLH